MPVIDVTDRLQLGRLCGPGGQITLRNLSFTMLENVMRFVYSGRVELDSREQLADLRDSLDMLKINIKIIFTDCKTESVKTEQGSDPISLQQPIESKKSGLIKKLKISKSLWSKKPKLSVGGLQADVADEIDLDGRKNFFQGLMPPAVVGGAEDRARDPDYSLNRSNSNNKLYGLQSQKIPCHVCGALVMYCKYFKHCKSRHPDIMQDWDKKVKCGTCRLVTATGCSARPRSVGLRKVRSLTYPYSLFSNAVPEIMYDLHMKIFGHGAVKKEKPSYSLDIVERNKALTKVPCEYCDEDVIFKNFKRHCNTHHKDVFTGGFVKCKKCGAKCPKISFKVDYQLVN